MGYNRENTIPPQCSSPLPCLQRDFPSNRTEECNPLQCPVSATDRDAIHATTTTSTKFPSFLFTKPFHNKENNGRGQCLDDEKMAKSAQISAARDMTDQQVHPKKRHEERQRGPRDVLCHICGRKYTIHSIGIHVAQCERLWEQRQEQEYQQRAVIAKNGYKLKPVPQLPDSVTKVPPRDMTPKQLEERNAMAMQVYNDHALEKCSYCHRTFLPDRLQVHLKSCARHHQRSNPKNHSPRFSNTVQPSQGSTSRPKSAMDTNDLSRGFVPCQPVYGGNSPALAPEPKHTALCHICGRKYTIHSIHIHIPQCEYLWQARQEQKGNRDTTGSISTMPQPGKPVPQLPVQFRHPPPTNTTHHETGDEFSATLFWKERNAMAQQIYETHTLIPCHCCGRTFLPDRLQVHLRSCERHHNNKHLHSNSCRSPGRNATKSRHQQNR